MLVLVRAWIICLVEKKLSGCTPKLVFRLSNRGERCGENARKLDIVVAYQGHIRRDGDPALDQTTHQTKREKIIRAKNSGGLYLST